MITERSVVGDFFNRLEKNTATSVVEAISSPPFQSDQDSEDYAWLGMVPQMTEKQHGGKFTQLRVIDWTVKNVEYQGGIAFPKKQILYDKKDQVQVRVNELADRATAHWWKLVAPLILNGESTDCYDGSYFYDSTHVEGDSGIQSNKISVDISELSFVNKHGTTTAPSSSEMIHSIMSGVQQMLQLKDDQGEYVNEELTEFLVLVPATLLTSSLSAMKSQSIDGGDSNLLIEQDSFRFRVLASPRLSAWTDKFALFSTTGTQKPIIRQQRIPNNAAAGYGADGLLVQTLWDQSEYCKLHGECLVSVETERAAAYGDWKRSCLVNMV